MSGPSQLKDLSSLSAPDFPGVLHIAQSDSEGGANKAAYRLHGALVDAGAGSVFHAGRLVRADAEGPPARSPWVGMEATRYAAFANAASLRLYSARKRRELFSPSIVSYGRPDPDLVAAADVVCLHWIAGAFLRPAQLWSIGKPLVWRLSDLWPFTGGCHYPGTCRKFEAACGDCPVLGSTMAHDLSRLGHRQRRNAYRGLDLTIVAPSRWIGEEARRSSLFADRRIVHIPTGVDLSVFFPRPQQTAIARFGLPPNRPIVLFGALGALDDTRKGFQDFVAAVQRMRALDPNFDATLVLFGGGASQAPQAIANLPVRNLGRIDSEDALADLYSAGDILVAPFREDNLPNVVLEAIACGTPVAAYAAGGIPDAVVPDRSGALATAGDTQDLAEAIRFILSDPARQTSLGQGARDLALEVFDIRACARAYAGLFLEVATASRMRKA